MKAGKKIIETRKLLDELLMVYILAFEKKHGREFEFAVADDLMGVISFGDIYYFHISDIVYDMDNDVQAGLIFEWLDDCVDNHTGGGEDGINFSSYAKGLRYKDF